MENSTAIFLLMAKNIPLKANYHCDNESTSFRRDISLEKALQFATCSATINIGYKDKLGGSKKGTVADVIAVNVIWKKTAYFWVIAQLL